jgi:lysyl-tRNA synthetase class II
MSQQLIKGEAFARQSAQPTWNKAFQERFSAGMQNIAKINAIKKAEKTAASNKVANYINQLNSDIDLTQLTGPQQNSVTNFLVRERDKYAQAASRIAKIDDPASKEYLDLRDQMNSVQRSFANLAGQLNKYKEDKISYLKDFDDKRISDGNDIGSLKEASKKLMKITLLFKSPS